MKKLLILCLLLIGTVVLSGVNYYGAGESTFLEDVLGFQNHTQKILTGDSDDPTSVAKTGGAGSIYLRTDGNSYIKQDAGSSTNWFEYLTSNSELNDLSDVTIVTPTASQSLFYTSGAWQNYQTGLNDLSDVIISDNVCLSPVMVPSDVIAWASYDSDEDLDFADGSETGTLVNNATVSGGQLLLNNNDVSYASYVGTTTLTGTTQVGTRRFQITPNYTGNPSAHVYIYRESKTSVDTSNQIIIFHLSNGALGFQMTNSAAGTESSISSAWSPTSGTTYDIELNFNATSGAHRLFVDGTQIGSTAVNVFTRDAFVAAMYVGAPGFSTNYTVNNFAAYDTVQHTANFTPTDWSEFTNAACTGASNHNILQHDGTSWVNSLDIHILGTMTASSYIGDGSGLTGIDVDLSTITASIQTNTDDIVTITASTQTNTDDILINANDIATNTASIQANTDDIVTIEASLPLYARLNDPTQTVTASAFVGDGSLLTNLPSGASTLGDLTDVNLTTTATGDVIQFDGSEWVNQSATFSTVTNITITGTGPITWVPITDSATIGAFSGILTQDATPTKTVIYLPTTLSVGDMFSISGVNTGGWELYTNPAASEQSLTYRGTYTATSSSTAELLAYSDEFWGSADFITISSTMVMMRNGVDAIAASGVPYPLGVVAHWKLDEGNSDALDYRNSYDLSKAGTLTKVVGKFDYAIDNISAANYLYTLYSALEVVGDTTTAQFTVEFWAKISNGNSGAMFSNSTSLTAVSNSFNIYMSGGNILFNQVGCDNVTQASAAYEDGDWHYFVATADNTSGTGKRNIFYIDGVEVGSNNSTCSYSAADGAIAVGNATGIGSYDDPIDDVVFWNGATMTASEVLTRYNAGAGARYYKPVN